MSRRAAAWLNQSCHCVGVDRPSLTSALNRDAGDPDFNADLIETRPHLFAGAPVFLSRADVAEMMEIVRAAELAARLPAFREAALARGGEMARADHGPVGAFMGYDFHLTDDGPKLIEINTNAGGAFLNAFLARAQRACCSGVDAGLAEAFDAAVVAMFENEWRRQGADAPLRRIAIVDDAPKEQYLFPDFVLAQRLLTRAGFDVRIVDAAELRYANGALRHGDEAIDLVYNRLVDFALEDAAHAALREAYRQGAVVVTPNPHNHAVHADKRNLALLSDVEQMARWGLPASPIERLSRLPRAVEVTEANAGALWAQRERYFFKPVAGHGGKAVYRGDKITKGVWARVCAGGYVAQELAAPSTRIVRVAGEARACKLDARLFTYDGRLLLAAARLYQGQTTNFRTPGGGFAPVLLV